MSGGKIFVGSLPNDITEDLLRTEFSRFGQVTEVYVKPGCEIGRQWAMVKFASLEQAQSAKENCDRVLIFPGSDKPCDVMLAKNQGMGGKGAQQPSFAGAYAVPAAASFQQPAPVASFGGHTASGQLARKVFVGSLPDQIDDATLRSEFSKYGTVEDIFIKPNCEPGRQWAFVNFASPDQAAYAAQMTNHILQFAGGMRPCEVTLARNQGMFGQDPMAGGAPATAMQLNAPVATGVATGALLSEAQRAPKKVFVGSLPDGITEDMLQAEFSKYGQITDIFLKTTCESNRQWAFITFASHEQAQLAKEACDRLLSFPGSDRPCEVTIARHQGLRGQDAVGLEVAPMPMVVQAGLAFDATSQPDGIEGPRKIFVGSLPETATEAVLRAEFSRYGQIMEVFIKQGQEPGRQWAFITFATGEQAAYAKESTDRVLTFPGATRSCEVTLARNQGKFGQAPLGVFGNGAPQAAPAQFTAAAAMPADPGQPPPPAAPPPAHLTPWRMYRTASGLPYYHNATTGVTQWDAPPDFQVPGQQAQYVAVQPQPAVAGQQRYSPY
mmetsp:Transcript_112911/g.353129  ORF Transcript_112911/g.353129 Transcript_112911/m.353129 type:complete len:553 (-) Transcript_112911:168-1826(-)